MPIIQGLFTVGINRCFLCLRVSFHKEGLIYATTLGCRELRIILTSGFYGDHEYFRKTRAYLNRL